jgi:DNA processing protein
MAGPREPVDPIAEERAVWVALNFLEGVGPLCLERLLRRRGSPREALSAPGSLLRELGAKEPAGGRRPRKRLLEDARRELRVLEGSGWSLVCRAEPGYPALLREIPDPPTVLSLWGELAPQDEVAVAVVGSRRATPYGLRVAEGLGASLAEAGVTVVSGMARGIDSAAHRGALEAGGRTLAVLGSGLDRIYPRENEALAEAIAGRGAVISEFPLGTPPEAGHFPRRNRVVSGLCQAVVVVEGEAGSGSLITARLALDQGREVGAVPGPVHSETSVGPHCLLREGAFLVQRGEDVLEALPETARRLLEGRRDGSGEASGEEDRTEPALGPAERAVLDLLEPEEARSVDFLLARCPRSAAEVLEALFFLELQGLVDALPGGLFLRRP